MKLCIRRKKIISFIENMLFTPTDCNVFGFNSIQKCRCQVWQGCSKDSAQLAQMNVWILISFGEYLRTHLKDHTRYDQGPKIHGKPKRVSLPVDEAQLAGCLRVACR